MSKDAHALVSYFVKKWKSIYGDDIVINRYKVKYQFQDILHDLSRSQVEGLIDFYFTTFSARRHPIEGFVSNYDKLLPLKEKVDSDLKDIEMLRQRTREKIEARRAIK